MPQDTSEFLFPKFNGRLTKFQLISNTLGFGPCPQPEEEIEQRFTIHSDGRVWLSRYGYGEFDTGLRLIEKTCFSVPSLDAEYILDSVARFFGAEFEIPLVIDAGSWDLTLTNAEGQERKVSGPLCHDLSIAGEGLSDIIRKRLGRPDLFVFDGNPDAIAKLDIQYRRCTKIKPGVLPPGASYEYITWDYSERLVLDRETETLAHSSEIGSGCKVTKTYHVEEGISSFLDGIDLDVFSETVGNPPDAVDNPLETREYEITILTKHGGKRVITGTFDKYGLPSDWPEFIDNVYRFMAFYGIGELFDARIYNKARRRSSDYIFCHVEFHDGGRTYCYLADTDEYCEGDLVVVPSGPENRESIVRIVSIAYHGADDAPFPLEKTKHILRKYTGEKPDDTEAAPGNAANAPDTPDSCTPA